VPQLARHQELGDEPGPTRLVRGANAPTRIAVEVLVEQQVVAEVGIPLHARVMPVDCSQPVLIPGEDPGEPPGKLVGDIVDRHQLPGTRRALDLEIVAIVVMKLLQGLDDEIIDGEPDGPAPVGVASEEAAVGLGRLIAHAEIHPVDAEHIGVLGVHAREGPNTIRRQSGTLASSSGSRVSTAKSGMSPTIERTLSGTIEPSGRCKMS
jgi:hypothetical protein